MFAYRIFNIFLSIYPSFLFQFVSVHIVSLYLSLTQLEELYYIHKHMHEINLRLVIRHQAILVPK